MNNDEELVALAKREPQQFVRLYDKYADRIYRYAQRELGDVAVAQDVVSATFEKAFKNLKRFRWRGVSFGAWLYKIARNEMMMYHRQQKRLFPLFTSFFSSHSVEQTVQKGDEADQVQRALRRLSRRDQEVLRLIYYEDLSHDEIGEVLGCSARNVAVRRHRALKRLKKQLSSTSAEVIFDVL
ncbi:MAG TPA: sigma-70 family RNA polymerase sigma factor [Anaerolineae bacterium]|nr:sigma-70 family RNA polymerase sigma factor [Anaerolineae bacterium]